MLLNKERMGLLYSEGATGWSMDDIRGYQHQSDARVSFIHVSVQPWLSSNTMKWKHSLLEHHQANSSDAEVLCMFRWERDGSVSKFWVQTPASWKVWTLLVKAWDVTYTAALPCWGRTRWLASAGRDAATKHASKWHSTNSRWTQQAAGFTASGHAGDEQLSVRDVLPVCSHLLWPGEIEWHSNME